MTLSPKEMSIKGATYLMHLWIKAFLRVKMKVAINFAGSVLGAFNHWKNI